MRIYVRCVVNLKPMRPYIIQQKSTEMSPFHLIPRCNDANPLKYRCSRVLNGYSSAENTKGFRGPYVEESGKI